MPDAERDHFDKVADYWNDPKSRWHIYSQHPHHLMLAEPVRVDATLKPGDTIAWGPATIRVLATPGHTDGSVSYLVEVDGRRVVFCGDAIYDEGRVWEIHSLQKGTQTTDYHGFLGARPELVESLGRIKDARPDVLVPSHGRVMTGPGRARSTCVVERLDACYDKYVAISALRHYFPKMFTEYAGRKDHMPIRPGKPVPECLRHFGTTWVLVSKDGAALVMDCGSPAVIEKLKELVAGGEIRAVEGLWVTHYHDDHVDAIPAFQKAFDCPCITDAHVAEVIADPEGLAAAVHLAEPGPGGPPHPRRRVLAVARVQAHRLPFSRPDALSLGPVGRGAGLADALRRRLVHHGGHRRLLREQPQLARVAAWVSTAASR